MQITSMDREWAESVAGRSLTIEKITQFKNEYEDWVRIMEDNMENNPENYTESF